jgi:hypothetical protein
MLLLDTTSEVIKKATYGTSNVNGRNYVNYMRFPLDPLSSVAIKFYKNNPSENYTYPGVYSWSVIWVNFQEP